MAAKSTLLLRSRGFWLSLALLAAVAGGGVGLWEGGLKDRFVPKRWGVVEPARIYRSGQLSPGLWKPTLAEHGIRVVVNLQTDDDPAQNAERQATQDLGIRRFSFPLRGNGTGDIRSYALALQEIKRAVDAGEPVLVHCSAGSQRTGGVVAAYRMLVQNRPPAEAYAELPRYGWRPGKDQILLDYVNGHMAELAGLLVEAGVIPRVPQPLPVLGPPSP